MAANSRAPGYRTTDYRHATRYGGRVSLWGSGVPGRIHGPPKFVHPCDNTSLWTNYYAGTTNGQDTARCMCAKDNQYSIKITAGGNTTVVGIGTTDPWLGGSPVNIQNCLGLFRFYFHPNSGSASSQYLRHLRLLLYTDGWINGHYKYPSLPVHHGGWWDCWVDMNLAAGWTGVNAGCTPTNVTRMIVGFDQDIAARTPSVTLDMWALFPKLARARPPRTRVCLWIDDCYSPYARNFCNYAAYRGFPVVISASVVNLAPTDPGHWTQAELIERIRHGGHYFSDHSYSHTSLTEAGWTQKQLVDDFHRGKSDFEAMGLPSVDLGIPGGVAWESDWNLVDNYLGSFCRSIRTTRYTGHANGGWPAPGLIFSNADDTQSWGELEAVVLNAVRGLTHSDIHIYSHVTSSTYFNYGKDLMDLLWQGQLDGTVWVTTPDEMLADNYSGGDTQSMWQYCLFSDFTDNLDGTFSLTLRETIPAGTQMTGWRAITKAAFAVSTTLQVGDGVTPNRWSNGTPQALAALNAAIGCSQKNFAGDPETETAVRPVITLTAASLAAGAVLIKLKWSEF
jgi:hypothetical protein